MSDTPTKKISELPLSTVLTNLFTIGVDENDESVKIPIGQMLNSLAHEIDDVAHDLDDLQEAFNDLEVTTEMIQDGAVTRNKIANNAINSDKIAPDSVGRDQLADESVNDDKLADEAVTTDKIADGAVSGQKLASGAVSTEKIADNAVTDGKLADGAVSEGKIGSGAVSMSKIADGAVGASKLADGAVGTGKIADGAVTGAKIGSQAVGMGKLAADVYASLLFFNVNVSGGNTIQTLNAARSHVAGLSNASLLQKAGLVLVFKNANGTVENWQYNGGTWGEETSWKALGSDVKQTLINVDNLCGSPSGASFYNLQTAIAAIVALGNSTGMDYKMSGLVITYKTAENTWETKQFKGSVSDFNETGLWQDFGGDGGQVETSDTPAEDGEDAFSTGGAYEHIPAGIDVDTETEGVVKLQMVNAGNQPVGDQIQFPIGTGGGGGTGTVVSLAFQSSPLYGSAGGTFILRAAVRSVTMVGSTEQANTIMTIELYDRDTNTLLQTFNFNQASSASMSTYDFLMDVTQYFATAGTRRFRCVATDDSGNTGSRNINITAVDVTISSVQTLQYTQSTALVVGGSPKSIPMYKFASNASDRGITACAEIYLNGAWRSLGTSVITDTYSHSITIDPQNCLGNVLAHGAYQIMIHGVDVASGVVGNYLYTGVFVIDETSTVPLVVESWLSETANAVVKLYETITLNYAVYDPRDTAPTATVYLDGEPVQTQTAYRSATYTYTHQVSGVPSDGTFSHYINVRCGNSYGVVAYFQVSGTVINAVLKSGAIYAFDFSNRSNDEPSHDITSGDYHITVNGSNWSTTGFITYKGDKCLRIAEDVTATLNHHPFQPNSLESNGMAIQFAFAAKNLVDDDAVLMECYDEGTGAGFYVTGKVVGIYCSTGTTNHSEERAYEQDKMTTVAVVVEPASDGLGVTSQEGTTYYFIKLYLDGEEVATIGYVAEQGNLTQNKQISFNGTQGDFYLRYALAWDDYFQFVQAFQNYLVKLTDTADMVREYDFEDVMDSQQVTELGVTTTKPRPQANELVDRDMAYIIECPSNGSNIEALDNTTSTNSKNYLTLYYYDPKRPWTDFKAEDVQRRNQGTTSALRPVKNARYYLAKKNGRTYDKVTGTGGTVITLLHTREEIVAMGYDGALWDKAAALAAINKVQIHEDSIPVDIITVKVDYSDSSNANDCGVCDQMNATFRALGSNYLTPAQRAFDGTWKKGSVELDGLVMNHSTANFPVAMYRSKNESGIDPYFHAKGNWKEDKKEQVALGFKDTPGYNKGCLNYGDFTEFYGNDGETLAQEKTRFLASNPDTSKTYILTQYCGSSYKVMMYEEGQWVEKSGSMVQGANGKWTVTGKVMNPVEGFELLQYQGMDWFKGVSSVADLMEPTSTNISKWVRALMEDGSISVQTVPMWTFYFESLVDDDDLAIAYALGKKVPYNLYRWMRFCDSCDWDTYHSTDGDGGAARLNRWKTELYKFASPYSCFAYDVFTDYDAAFDQRAKNMQPMWFLEDGCKVENGVYYNANNQPNDTTTGMLAMRMYLNKVYDCDTCNGKNNDGGIYGDAEVDPNKLPDPQTGYTNPYAGYMSVLFRNMYLQQIVYIDGNNTELSLKTVAAAMRSCSTTVDGITLNPFSPVGALHFFVDARIKRWQKNVSSYDGERKYIDFTPYTDGGVIYFYALQGLGLTSLPAFIERRWRIRDGFYGTGDFFSGAVLSGRVKAESNATITIKAAKTGYFGIGNDSVGSLTENVYLEAGQTHVFRNFSHEEGALLFIYQADRMSMIDLSEINLSSNFNFSVMTLAEEIYIGKVGKVNEEFSYTPLTSLNLGELPFLKVLDITDTLITNVVCTSCPRLESLYAAGSQLTRADIADGAKITLMQLPATYNYLRLRYLPNLTITGLQLANPASVNTLIVENCAKISAIELVRVISQTTGTGLRVVRAAPVNVSYDGSDLEVLAGLPLTGLDANLTAQAKPAIVGTYVLTKFKDNDLLASWRSFFGNDLTIHQAQFTTVEFDDTVTDPANVSNLDNETGYKFNNAYVPNGHISVIRERLIPISGQLVDGIFRGKKIKESGTDAYRRYADGTDFNYQDTNNSGNDSFMRIPHCWYKGINDFKNQKKYICWSSLDSRPISTSIKEPRRATLSNILTYTNKGIEVDNIQEGVSTLESEGVVSYVTNVNIYSMDVEGMKQVRWPGINDATLGACFLNAQGVIISTFKMNIEDALFDFVDGEYVFTLIPPNAKTLAFTTSQVDKKDNDISAYINALEAIAVDSDNIEAIEPDWVESDECLGGIYEASVDRYRRLRSISGATVRVGTGTNTTSSEWNYNEETGDPINTPEGTMNWTAKDLQNLSRRRGAGYQLFDYEMSKLIANLYFSFHGNRDSSRVLGRGKSSGGTTGYMDSRGNSSSTDLANTSGNGNKCLGFESFFACTYEWMDMVAVNVTTFEAAYKAKMVTSSSYPTNAKWHIYDPIRGTERVVQGISGSGNNIARVKHGRFCDVIASKCTTDTSAYVSNYCDGNWYSALTCLFVGRASTNAGVYGGVVCAYAVYAWSSSSTYVGSRLAFRGQIQIVD